MTIELAAVDEYPDVRDVLEELAGRLQSILGEQFVGLYLYGSLASGDFNPQQSDIDFVVVTASDLSNALTERLKSMHAEFANKGDPWAARLEGKYLPLYAVPRYEPDHPAYPTVNEGRFYIDRQGSDWVIQRETLRQHAAVVYGPDIAHDIEPVGEDELKSAVLSVIDEWWEPMIEDPVRFENPEYQAYAVLSMCRALYTLTHGELVSKAQAANWASNHLDSGWKDLIENAVRWKRGEPTDSLPRTIEFMKYALAKIRQEHSLSIGSPDASHDA